MNNYFFGTIPRPEDYIYVVEIEIVNFMNTSQVGWVRIASFTSSYDAMVFFKNLSVKARLITENVL